MNNELIERIDAEIVATEVTIGVFEEAMPSHEPMYELRMLSILKDCKAALNKYHEQQQGLIGSRTRLQIEIAIAESLIEDPNYEMSAMEFEYENSWHDKLKAALTQQGAEPEAWLVERIDGYSLPYSPARTVLDAKKSNPMSDNFWIKGEVEKYKITPLHPPKPAAQPHEAEPCWDETTRRYMCVGDCPNPHTKTLIEQEAKEES